MRTSRLAVPAVALTAIFATAVSVATTPPPEGRPLPAAMRQLIWDKACDLVPKDWAVDCAANTDPARCGYRRSDGEAFEPVESTDVRSFTLAHYGVGADVLKPAAEASGWEKAEDKWGDYAGPAFTFISGGLTLSTTTPYEVTTLTPEALAWIERELIPERSQAMCGKTAGEVYDASQKTMLRTSALAWEAVKKSGKLKGLTVERLAKDRGTRRGATWTMCATFATRESAKGGYDERMLRDECQFWLRRGVVGQADAVAAVLGALLQRFDASFFEAHAKAFAPPSAGKRVVKRR
jgi:hypothetical protein